MADERQTEFARKCPTCGTTWTAPVEACPVCPDVVPMTDAEGRAAISRWAGNKAQEMRDLAAEARQRVEPTTEIVLTRKQREALVMLAERTTESTSDPGIMCSDATFADTWNVFINWRTAQALHRAGLVTYPYIGSGYDGDGTSVALTEAGRAAATQEADRG